MSTIPLGYRLIKVEKAEDLRDGDYIAGLPLGPWLPPNDGGKGCHEWGSLFLGLDDLQTMIEVGTPVHRKAEPSRMVCHPLAIYSSDEKPCGKWMPVPGWLTEKGRATFEEWVEEASDEQ